MKCSTRNAVQFIMVYREKMCHVERRVPALLGCLVSVFMAGWVVTREQREVGEEEEGMGGGCGGSWLVYSYVCV